MAASIPTAGDVATLHLHGDVTCTHTVAWATPCGSRVAIDAGPASVHLFADRGYDGSGNPAYFWNGFLVTFDAVV
jgi:hypothetical protein